MKAVQLAAGARRTYTGGRSDPNIRVTEPYTGRSRVECDAKSAYVEVTAILNPTFDVSSKGDEEAP